MLKCQSEYKKNKRPFFPSLASGGLPPVNPPLGQRLGFRCLGFIGQVIEDFLDHHRVFDAGNDLNGAAAFTAGFNVDVEEALAALCPGHRCPTFDGRLRLIGCIDFVALAPLSGRHHSTVFAVGCRRGSGSMPTSELCGVYRRPPFLSRANGVPTAQPYVSHRIPVSDIA